MSKSELGLGTWQFGPSYGFWTGQDRIASRSVLKLALKRGIHYFDTAPSYGNGASEQLLGSVIARHENVHIATKFMPKKPELVRRDLEKSLGRLKMSFVDTLFLHWPSSSLSIRPILQEVCTLIDEGLVRQLGVCNTPLSYLQALEDLPISTVQIPCSLLWTRSLNEYRQYAKDHRLELVGYSPLGLGLLGGNHIQSPQDGRKDLYVYRPEAYGQYCSLLEIMDKLAVNKGYTMAQIALLWSRSQGFSTILVGARSETQLEELLTKPGLELDEEDISLLDEHAQRLCSCAPAHWDNYFGHRW